MTPTTSPRYAVTVGGVDVRLQFDLVGSENDEIRHILYNLKGVPLEADTVRLTLEIASWVLSESGSTVPLKSIEHVEISTGASKSIKGLRTQTVKHIHQNAKVIQALWATI